MYILYNLEIHVHSSAAIATLHLQNKMKYELIVLFVFRERIWFTRSLANIVCDNGKQISPSTSASTQTNRSTSLFNWTPFFFCSAGTPLMMIVVFTSMNSFYALMNFA